MYNLIRSFNPEFKLEWEPLFNNRTHIKFERMSTENDINGMKKMLENKLYKDFLLVHVKNTYASWWCEFIEEDEPVDENCKCELCELFRKYK